MSVKQIFFKHRHAYSVVNCQVSEEVTHTMKRHRVQWKCLKAEMSLSEVWLQLHKCGHMQMNFKLVSLGALV